MVVTRVVQDQSSWPPSKSKFINMLCVCVSPDRTILIQKKKFDLHGMKNELKMT